MLSLATILTSTECQSMSIGYDSEHADMSRDRCALHAITARCENKKQLYYRVTFVN